MEGIKFSYIKKKRTVHIKGSFVMKQFYDAIKKTLVLTK